MRSEGRVEFTARLIAAGRGWVAACVCVSGAGGGDEGGRESARAAHAGGAAG